jgi:F-type H+-transporting ATPase subunit delta
VSAGLIGQRYGSALLQLAIEANAIDRFGRELNEFSAMLKEGRELRALFENPAFSAETRRAFLREVATRMAMSTQVRNLLLLLSDRRRMRYLPDIVETFFALAEERSGKIRAEVTYASDLPEGYFFELSKVLEGLTGKQVTIVKKQDPSLIGGVVTRVGDRVFDGSIRNHLIEIRDELRTKAITM